MKRIGWVLVFLITTMILAVNAGADVVYQLTANNASFGSVNNVNITFTSPTFITSFTQIGSQYGTTFSNTPNATCNFGGATCYSLTFNPDYPGFNQLYIYNSSSGGSTDLFYFAIGAFGSFGTYNESLCGNFDCTGRGAVLTVSEKVSETPEPGTLALLGTGLLGIAGPLRRKLKF
jgi:hypothetical protein